MKLMLIGGGDIGRSNTKYETKEIDEKIVKLSNKENPNFLFIGLASNFSDSYYKVIKDIYKNLGCKTGKISNKTLTHIEVVEEKIKNADIIYIGGGDTVKLVNIIDKMLKEKLDTESVLVGISAGAISYVKSGLSDTEIINNISNNYVKVDGLGFIDYMFVPHFSSDSKKMEDLEKVLKNDKENIALCTDNCAAIEIIDGHINVVKSDIKAKAYKGIYKDKLYLEEIN